MAEAQVKQVLEKEVTCPLCLEIFKEPKKLPCDHVYCKQCLGNMAAVHNSSSVITCPECRTLSPIPSGDVNKFPTAFQVNRLTGAFRHISSVAEDTCNTHPNQKLVIYCETCKIQLCRDCVLKAKDHVTHKYEFINVVACKYRKEVSHLLSLAKIQESVISNSLTEIAASKDTIMSHARRCQNDIDQAFEELISASEKQRRAMKLEATEHYCSLTSDLEQQMQQLQDVQNKLGKMTASIDENLQESDCNFILTMDSTISQFKKLEKQLKTAPLNVAKPQLLISRFASKETFLCFMETTCVLQNAPIPQECTLDGPIPTNRELLTYQENTLLLTLRDTKGATCRSEDNRVEAELVNLQGATISGTMKQVSPGCVKIVFNPKTRGRCTLNVKVNGEHVQNSPFTVTVNMPPKSISLPVATITGLECPSGLTLSQEKVLATEKSQNRIIEIDSEYHVREHRTLFSANKLTLDMDQNIYVTTTEDHKVHKLGEDGKKIKVIGQFGAQHAEFNCPSGLRVRQNCELFVCDSKNCRIQVFDLDLNYKRSFGKKGTSRGQFKFPSDIEFDSGGKMYIVDSQNHCIQVFAHNEQHVCTIGNEKSHARFSSPVGILMHNNHIYVTNAFIHNVVVMKLTGEVITVFGDGHLSWPEGITVDRNGYLYVTSLCSIYIF